MPHGPGRTDALNGLKRALAVHRVNGEPAWTVRHPVNTAIHLAMDGPPGKPVVIAFGFSRTPVNLGPVTLGIGVPFFPLLVGALDPSGDASLELLIPPTLSGFTLTTQGLVDDTTGATGELLPSNVIGVTFVP